VRRRVDHFEQLHDVGVVQACEDVDLAVDGHQLALLRQQLLLVRLQGYLVAGLIMRRLFDDSESALANHLVDFEIVLQLEYRVFLFAFQHLDQLNELVASFVLVRNLFDKFAASLRRGGRVLLARGQFGRVDHHGILHICDLIGHLRHALLILVHKVLLRAHNR
jgi:hypothetical protein